MENFATTHEGIPVAFSTNKLWWQFWKPSQIYIMVSTTVNRDLGVALRITESNY
ncbi:hypothetical protein [Candidatus Enterovibrio escicola]|uniref:hypothetical protein n=1 Tax=Candidatus Enterovibrio escicola TaxID=1927127 RepID=UPI0016803B6F|nr:hypothetical protein [Candidatus Enterovibrio escacola]